MKLGSVRDARLEGQQRQQTRVQRAGGWGRASCGHVPVQGQQEAGGGLPLAEEEPTASQQHHQCFRLHRLAQRRRVA